MMFYTTTNPFNPRPFNKWLNQLPTNPKFLEPFAGSNNLLTFAPIPTNKWRCFDIDPNNNDNVSGVHIHQHDSLKIWPGNKDDIVITNPPYLAKNKHNLNIPQQDLYLFCLDKILTHTNYACLILPLTFTNQIHKYKKHIYLIDCVNKPLFTTTTTPAVVVYFIKDIDTDFLIYNDGKDPKTYSHLLNLKPNPKHNYKLKFNDPNGQIGLYAVDTTYNYIHFTAGAGIKKDIKPTSRHITRISIHTDHSIPYIIDKANDILNKYRRDTNDFFLSSFKGFNKHNKPRRRLTYTEARNIISSI